MDLKGIVACVAIVSAAVLGTSTANAASITFDDGTAAQTGTISYDGEGGALVGTNIVFDSVLGSGTPANDGVALVCEGCLLNFTTGLNTGEGPSQWTFGDGGSFVLTGTVKTGGGTVIAAGTLLTGVFNDTPTVIGPLGSGIFVGYGTDEKDPRLLDFYNVGVTEFIFANTEIALGSCSNAANGGFKCAVQNADLENSAVPIPAAAWLFGSALLGLAGVARRRRIAA